MKNTIILAMLGATALVSCSMQIGDTNSFQPHDGEIYFGSKLIDVTKAVAESTVGSIQANGFKATVVNDNGNTEMFSNKVLQHHDGVYTVNDESYFYPLTGTISAYAAYPASEAITLADGVATLNYSQKATEDLIVAKATGVAKQGNPINLGFGHALSQVSFKVKGTDIGAVYKLKLIEVIAPASGTYRYASDDWSNLGAATSYNAYTNAGAALSTDDYQAFGESMTFIPGDAKLHIKWECYNKSDGTLIASYDQKVATSFVKGERSTIRLSLSNGAADKIITGVSISSWDSEEKEIEITPAPALFTVNSSGKKVKFTKGNLYWNGSDYAFEEHQYDYPTTRNADHIGHFFYSKDAVIARSERYKDASRTISDVLFAANGGAIPGFTILDNQEWKYLIDHNMQSESTVSIAGVKCAVIVPDGYDGIVASSYTASEWEDAEAEGLVAIPCAGYYANASSSFREVGDYAYCWCAPVNIDETFAWYARFNEDPEKTRTDMNTRTYGCSIRLVVPVQ